MTDKNPKPLEVIADKQHWRKALNEISHFDFYHTYDYHHLSKLTDDKAVLLKYTEKNKTILFPILIRKINGTHYFDVTSVYGYAGPLQKNIADTFDNRNFHIALNDYFIKENIIAAFSRLNPFIDNQFVILKNIGQVMELGRVVNIDLTKDLETQRACFSKTTKRYLNKAKRILDIRISDKSQEDIDTFIEIYYENMDRVKAQKKYYFSKDFFNKFILNTNFDTELLFAICKKTKQTISAVLMVKTNNIIQYHLSGTKAAYLHVSPMRFLINEMRIKGTQEQFKYFNLGGGLGNNQDELFRFKASFSKDFRVFKTWNLIVNNDIYNQLVIKNNITRKNNETSYFPLYRLHETDEKI